MMSEVEKLCFWTGFLTGRHFKAIPTLLKLGPLSTEGLERLRTAAKERNAWALERLASLLQGVQAPLSDKEVTLFFEGREFYLRNKDTQIVVDLTGDDGGQLQLALEYMFDTYGIAKIEDVMIFVSNKEIMNYQDFFTTVNFQEGAHVEEEEEEGF